MKKFNQQLKMRTVVERWDEEYKDSYEKWPDKLEVLQKLELLDSDKCSAKDIDDIIGNKSWTHFMCMECEEYKSKGVVMRYDTVCMDCIKDALVGVSE